MKLLYLLILPLFIFPAGANAKDGCAALGIQVTANFEAARIDKCIIDKHANVLLTIQPENQPINDSPWYAFTLRSSTPKSLNVQIRYLGGSQRYRPKVSLDAINWQLIEHQVIDERLVFDVDASTTPIYISAQELVRSEDYLNWMTKQAESTSLVLETIGKSSLGRPIHHLQHMAQGNEWVVIVGRQHPPEVTGAMALFPFVESLMDSSTIAQDFRQRFNLIIIPFLNPDGVFLGNWRHNANGIDLNRDWGKFTQIETRLVRDKLSGIVGNGDKMVFGLDFHSTRQDIFYTMPTDYDIQPALLTENWLNTLTKKVSGFTVTQRPGTSPGRGVFKQYFADTFKVHAITYEVGDQTERGKIKEVAKLAADSFMAELLNNPKAAFSGNRNQ